jgi:pimeloyl-ACP methyl ester carboxylesterase
VSVSSARSIWSVAGSALVVGGLASAVYQARAERRDACRFPPPGHLVDIGGRRLHLWRMGTGGPTVVIVSALGASCLEWVGVQRKLAENTTVYVYDRAGLGWSDPAPWPRGIGEMTDELHRLLDAAAVPAPYVLVGQSLGGLVARLYAARHPQMVGGLVLVDSSHEDMYQRLARVDSRINRFGLWRYALQELLVPLGVKRLATNLGVAGNVRRDAERSYPSDLVAAGVALALSSQQRWADVQEMLCFVPGMAVVRAEARGLGHVPLTVVTAGRRDQPERDVWFEMQRDLAALSSVSVHVVAENAGHHVHLDDPDLLVREILQCVAVVRETRTSST